MTGSGLNTVLRLVLLVWVLGSLFVACSGIFNGDLVGAGLGLIFGTVLFVPWLLGVFVLAALVWLTNSGRVPGSGGDR